MQVIKADERVRSHLAHNLKRNSLEIVLLDERQNVRAHGLEDHADVLTMRTKMLKVVDELNNPSEGQARKKRLQRTILRLRPLGMHAPLRCLCQELDLIISSLRVVRRTLLNLQSNEAVVGHVLAEPDGGEVAPAQLRNDMITVVVHLTDGHGVVASLAIAICTLVISLFIFLGVCTCTRRWLHHTGRAFVGLHQPRLLALAAGGVQSPHINSPARIATGKGRPESA
mmetsp:Transcript_1112/g.2180  ORF Transcript_1112/g.2180 Transcript_1112/m.2180 type:complete len:227 (+) Transcript_1112:1540-2220(+)